MPPIMQLSMDDGSGPILYWIGSLFFRACAARMRLTCGAHGQWVSGVIAGRTAHQQGTDLESEKGTNRGASMLELP
eukprot:126986-Chlamydomonas_euryale.AAC.2